MYRHRSVPKTSGPSRASILPSILMLGGGLVGLGSYVKGSVLLKQYWQKIQLQDDNGPVEPSVKLEDMTVEVCDNIKNSISENTPIRPILIPGTHTIHAGTIGTFQGGVIGLPTFFEFNKIEDIEGKIQWDEASEMDINEIYNAFLLSDKAKKYGIAREILLVNTPQLYIDTVLPVAVAYLINAFETHPSIQSEIVKMPNNSKNLFYVLLFALGILIMRSLHMKLQRRYENKAETTISQLGGDYIEGAVEYNSKIIQRNLCSATMKDQNKSILKHISDLTKLLFSTVELPSQKVRFYTSLNLEDSKMKNEV